nr:uncharacterized protein LOC111994644 [Quercus suber]
MAPEDMEKAFFITPWGIYCYKIMPFGLKNAGATKQWAATTLLHDLIHKEVEVYVDDMIVKSKDCEGHTPALQKFFKRIRFYKLKLNPKKCTFVLTFGKLLGFMDIKQVIHRSHFLFIGIWDGGILSIEMGVRSLRIVLESEIPKVDWLQSRYDQLCMMDEKRHKALYHIQGYQRRLKKAFDKKVRARDLKTRDLVLKEIQASIQETNGKFKQNWAGPYIIKQIYSRGAVRLMD